MTSDQLSFLNRACDAARSAGHPWPEMAACEAALESRYGTSVLAQKAVNFFGVKSTKGWLGPTLVLPTTEYRDGKKVTENAYWRAYPSWEECFKDQLAIIERVKLYAKARAATNAETYVRELSAHWSTDPKRAEKVIGIYRQFKG